MVRWTLRVALVLALLSPLPVMISPTPGEVSVSTATVEWDAGLLVRPPWSEDVTVVDITGLPTEEKLTYISLQGLVNRESGSVYLIQAETDPYWLDVIMEQNDITIYHRRPTEFAEANVGVPRGYVIVDPRREDTVNVATTISGVERYLIVLPSRLERFRETFGNLPVIDLRNSPWSERSGTEIYTYAFDRYFSRCTQRFLGFFPSWIHFGRDLLISNSAFAFYAVPGPFSDPFRWEEVRGILRATPHTHALIGSIEPYIGAEEDFAIRDFSLHGKFFIPMSRVPNLSILCTFPQREDVDLGAAPRDEVVLKDKHYVTIAVEDGDNIAFIHDGMTSSWLNAERGEFPIAWTVPPYLKEFAPPFLDHYYSTRSENDTFMMAPSGAGLAFPDFLPDGAIDRYLELTEAHVDDMNISFAWILNAYRTFEVKYTDGLIDSYVGMGLDGLVLDYDDMPWHDQYTIAGDGRWSAPVIRSTQLWRSSDNLRAKIDVAADAYPERPLFTLLAYNPWSLGLSEMKALLDDMDLEIVDMATFFELIRLDALDNARRTLDTFRSVPTSFMFGHWMDSAERFLDRAEEDGQVNTYAAWRAREQAEVGLALSLAALLVIVTAVVAVMLGLLVFRSGKGPPGVPAAFRLAAMTLLFSGFAVMYYRVQFSETWNYLPLAVSMVAIPVIAHLVRKRAGDTFLRAGAVLFVAGALACYVSWWAFPFYAFGLFMLLDWTANGHMDEMVVALSLGLPLAMILPGELDVAVALALMTPVLLLVSGMRRGERAEGRTAVTAPLILPLLIIGSVMHDSRYMVYRFDFLPVALTSVSIVVPLAACGIGWLVMKTPVRRFGFYLGLVLFVHTWALVPFIENIGALSVLILVQQVGLVMMALEAARRGTRRANQMYPALAISFFMFYNMAFYTTPVILDVYFVHMDYWMNFILYHHPVFFLLLAGVLLTARIAERFLAERIVGAVRKLIIR